MQLIDKIMQSIKLKLSYDVDEVGRVVRVRVNKPEKHRTEKDQQVINALSAHFVSMGLAVIVED